MAATIAAIIGAVSSAASAVGGAAAAGAGALGSAAAAIPGATGGLLGGGGAAAGAGAAPLAATVPFTGAAEVAGGLGGAAPFSGAVGEGVGAGALGALPSGATMPGAAMPGMMDKIMGGLTSASTAAQNPGGTGGQLLGKALGASEQRTKQLGVIGEGLASAPQPGPGDPPRPIAPGRPTQLAQPVTQVASQFAIGPDGLLHWTGAPMPRVGGGLA